MIGATKSDYSSISRRRRRVALGLAGALVVSPVAADDRVRVEAESLRHEQGVVRAEGEAKAHYQGYELCAARLIYDRQERRIRAEEEVRLTREGYRLSGDRLEFDLDDGTGAAGASEALTPEDLRLLGATLRIEGKDLFAEEVYATRCPAEDEDWRLNASSAHLDSEAKTLFLRDLYLDVGGVPVLYLPKGSFYYGEEPQNGFLFPTFGLGSDGASARLPYYLRFSDRADLTMTPYWKARYGLELANELRFLTPRAEGELLLSAVPFEEENRDRQEVAVRFNRGAWRGEVNVRNVSDDDYLKDFGEGADETSSRHLVREARAVYDGGRWRMEAEMQGYKTLDRRLTAPHRVLPRVALFYADVNPDFDWRSDWAFSRFRHSDPAEVEGDRVLWRGDIGRTRFAGNYSMRLLAGGQAVFYQTKGRGDDSAFVPYIQGETSWTVPFDLTDDRRLSEHLRFRGGAVYSPFVRQEHLPLYDTGTKQRTLDNVFSWNRFAGGDRAGDLKALSFAAEYRAIDDGGRREAVFFGLGQRYYLSSPKLRLEDGPAPEGGVGNLLMEGRLNWFEVWHLATDAEYNFRTGNTERVYAQVAYQPSERRLFRVGVLSDDEDTADFGFASPLSERLEVGGRVSYSMSQDYFSESGLSFRLLDDCACWSLTFSVEDRVVKDGKNETEFSFGIHLFGLGGVGGDYDRHVFDADSL